MEETRARRSLGHIVAAHCGKEIHNLSKCHDHQEHFQYIIRIMQEARTEEMCPAHSQDEGMCGAMKEREKASKSCSFFFVEKLIHGADGGAKMLIKLLNHLPGEEGQHSSRRHKKMRVS